MEWAAWAFPTFFLFPRHKAVSVRWIDTYPTLMSLLTPDSPIVAHNTDVGAVKAITKVLDWQVKSALFFAGGAISGIGRTPNVLPIYASGRFSKSNQKIVTPAETQRRRE
jgi:hypothetical protein